MTDRLTATLAELVRTPSVNPDEGLLAGLVASRLGEIGAEVLLVESLPGRHSVGARLVGAREGPGLLLNGHLDTVAPGDPELWSHDPFGAEVVDGALYGRGSCDMKAGLAVMLEVAARIAARRADLSGELVLHFAIGEERAEPGTRSLLEAGFRADVGIVVEPTLLRVATAGRGGAALEIRIVGRSGHAGMPAAARNPIAALPSVLTALAEHEAGLAAAGHPLLPPASLTPTVIRGGDTPNTIPGEVSLVVDRRLLPGEELAADAAALERRLATPGVRVEVVAPENHWRASETPDDVGFADLVKEVAMAAGCARAGEDLGTPYATDVGSLIVDGGVEAVVFGAGDVAFAHRPDERVDLGEAHLAAVAVEGVVERLLFE